MNTLMDAMFDHIIDHIVEGYFDQTNYWEYAKKQEGLDQELREELTPEQLRKLELFQEMCWHTQCAELKALYLATFDQMILLLCPHNTDCHACENGLIYQAPPREIQRV